jgi:hypothetical protein
VKNFELLKGSVDIGIPEGGWRRSTYRKGVLHGLSRHFQVIYLMILLILIKKIILSQTTMLQINYLKVDHNRSEKEDVLKGPFK